MGLLLDYYNAQEEQSRQRRETSQYQKNQAIRRQWNDPQFTSQQAEEERLRKEEERKRNQSNLQKIGSAIGGVAQDIGQSAGNIIATTGRKFGIGNQPNQGPSAIQLVQQARNRPDSAQVDEILKQYKNPAISAAVLRNAAEGKNIDELRQIADQTSKQIIKENKKLAGDVAVVGSLAIPGGAGIRAAKGATQLARPVATSAASGYAGGVGYELSKNPDQSILDAATSPSAALGAVGGAALPLAGAGVRRLDSATKQVGKKTYDSFIATTPGQKFDEGIRAIQTKLQSSTTPINRQLNQLQKDGKLSENQVKNVKSLIQTARQSSNTLANDFLKNDDAAKTLFAPINNKPITNQLKQDLSDYINARNELNLINSDIKRGAKVSPTRKAQFEATVRKLENPEFAARFDADVALNSKLTDLLVDEGIVSAAQRDVWRKTNTEYIRVQRVLEDMSEIRGKGGGASPASRGSTIADQRRKGSTKEAQDALEVAVDRTNRVFREITSNRAANAYIDALKEAGVLGKQLRSAENVAMRQELRDALRFSRPLKNQLARFEKTQKNYVKGIQNELDKLNRAGLDASLAKSIPDENLAGKLIDPGAKLNKQELQSVLDNIVQNTDTKVLQTIRKKISKRDPKLAKAIQELEDIQSTLAGVNAKRSLEYQEVLKLADKQVRGRPTIQRRVNGIKEIYETTPEIELAAKGMGPVYTGTLGRVISAPVRFLQTTITGGLNPAWTAISIPRDFIEGLVLSRRATQTHNPANILNSIAEMSGAKSKELFDKFMSYERGASSVIDLTRNAKSNAQTIRELSRASLPKVKRAGTVIKSPREWYGTLQEASKWNEYLSKYQNFRGNYNKLIQEGTPEDQAFNIALYEGRHATGNLLETGDWTRALQAIYPYFNPTIQGGASLARSFKERPVATSAKIITAVQIPAAVSTAWNLSDPRRAEIYLDIPSYERERFNIIVLPGTEKSNGEWGVFKIPKPPGVGNFANPVERLMVNAYGRDPGDFENFAQSIIKAMGSPIDPNSASSAIGSTIPFQLKTPLEAVSNYNFYSGKQVVPDWVKEANPDEPYKQAFTNTSSTYKKIGQALGISPLIVQKVVSDTTGEFGKNVVYLSDTAQELAGADNTNVGGRSLGKSFSRTFYGSQGGERQREVGQTIDRIVSDRTRISSQITEALKSKDDNKANELAREHNKRIDELEQLVTGSSSDLRKLSDKQKELLKRMRFPLDGDSLSQSSINSRLR